MASARVVETSVANNSPSQDSNHPDDLFQSRNIIIVSGVVVVIEDVAILIINITIMIYDY